MSGQAAQVRSLEALESLRSAMIQYRIKSRRSVDIALEEIKEMRQWLLVGQRLHWEGKIRQGSRMLEQARAELLTVRFSGMVDRSIRHEEAVRKLTQAVEHASQKLKAVKRWARDFENAVGPHVRRLESVREHLTHDIPKATAFLHQAQVTLESYAEARPSSAPPGSAAAGEASVLPAEGASGALPSRSLPADETGGDSAIVPS